MWITTDDIFSFSIPRRLTRRRRLRCTGPWRRGWDPWWWSPSPTFTRSERIWGIILCDRFIDRVYYLTVFDSLVEAIIWLCLIRWLSLLSDCVWFIGWGYYLVVFDLSIVFFLGLCLIHWFYSRTVFNSLIEFILWLCLILLIEFILGLCLIHWLRLLSGCVWFIDWVFSRTVFDSLILFSDCV